MLAEPAHRPRVVMLSKTFRQGLPISRGASHGVAWLRTTCMATHSQAVFSHGGRGCIEATTALRQSKQPHSRRHCACRAVRPRSLMVLRAMKDSKPADFVSIFLPSFKTKPPVSGAESAGSSGTSGKASEISFEGANRQPYEASGQSSDATAKGTAPAIPEAVRSPQSGDGDKGIISGGETVKLSGSSGSGGKLPPGIPRPGAGGGGETPEDGPRKAHYGSLSFLQVLVGDSFRGPFLFLVGGAALSCGLIAWAKGSDLRLIDPYTFTVTYPTAMGLDVGTPLRLMGVQVGVVKAVRSALENVEAVVQVPQKSTRIPKGCTFVFNKAGALTPSACIDIRLPKMEEEGEPSLSPNYTMPSEGSSNVSAGSTSRSRSRSHTSLSGAKPISAADLQSYHASLAAAAEAAAGPDDIDACHREGLLVCSGDRVRGVVGGGMDEFSALLLRNMMKGAEQHQLPPGLRNMTRVASV